jgi:hypothetical protein
VIVDTFSWPDLQSYFRRLVSSCSGADWREITTKLSRYDWPYDYWEFEDYAPDTTGPLQ